MRMRKMITLAVLALAIAIPGVSLAKKDSKHGIGKGGVPALRDFFLEEIEDLKDAIASLDARVGELETANEDTQERLAALEGQFADADGDGSFVLVPDCNDGNANVSPNAVEIKNNGIDDDCDPNTAD